MACPITIRTEQAALTSCPKPAQTVFMGNITTGANIEGSGNSKVLSQVRSLLLSQRLGVLGTRFEEAPHQSLVAFVASEDLREIYFATPAQTRKAEALSKDTRVALLVDHRKNLGGDFDASIAITAMGSAELLEAFVDMLTWRGVKTKKVLATGAGNLAQLMSLCYTLDVASYYTGIPEGRRPLRHRAHRHAEEG